MTDEPRDPELLAAEVDALRRQVTELRAETAARDQERRTLGARLLGLHAKSPVAIGFSRDGINVGANPAYLRLFGYGSEQELIGTSLLQQIAPSARPDIIGKIEARKRGEAVPSQYETVGLRKDGSEFPFEIHIARVDLAEGFVTMVFVEDISERKRAADALRENNALLEAITEGTSNIICVKDRLGRIVYLNSAMARFIGKPASELVGTSDLDLVSDPTEAARIIENDRRVMETGQTERVEEAGTSPAGPWIYLLTKSPFFDGRGQVTGVCGIGIDITEHRRLEKERERLQADLFQAQKMEAIGTLAGGIAHDFNNILGGVLGGLSLLELELGEDAARNAGIEDMKALVHRGADLSTQLLGFARRGQYDVRPLDLARVVEKTSTMFGRTHRNVAIRHDFAPGLLRVVMDHAQLEQVLLNLFLNAGQAMPGGGDLLLRAQNAVLSAEQTEPHGARPGRFVEVIVADTGLGMDLATQARIFEPFFTTKALGHGSGLGLASVYGIVKTHGGIIRVESEPGQGAAFTLYLPATDEAAADEAKRAAPLHFGRGLLLVVDDEEQLRRTCRRLLEKLGYEVMTAAGGREAIDLVREHKARLSLVILDLTMPEMSGARTYEALREIAPDVKVLLASGFSVEGQAQELLARGCNGFIQKPFDVAALSAKLRELL